MDTLVHSLIAIPSSGFTPPFSGTRLPTILQQRHDYLTGSLGKGVGQIEGTVKVDGSPDVPVHRRVRLLRERDGRVMREVWSDKVTGSYLFDYLDELEIYTVISYDYSHTFRTVAADNITPDLMP